MEKVIACIDGSRASESVCDHAAWAARRLHAPLTLLHVTQNRHADQPADLSGNLTLGGREQLLKEMVELEEQRGKLAREQGKLILGAAIEHVQSHGVAEPGRLLRHGTITEALTDLQEQTRLVVLGKQGKDGDMVERHVGSHLESIIRTLSRPILVAPLSFQTPQRFMIGYDGSATAQKVVERVAMSPLLAGLPAHLLMVDDDHADNRNKLESAAEQLRTAGYEVHSAIRTGAVAEAVCAYRKEHDLHLLAMGAYGRSRLRQFFVGSTTTRMIMQSPMPLLILR